MDPTVAAACYAVVLATSVWASGPLRPDGDRPRVPWATAGALVVIGTVSLLQLTVFPALLGALQRRPHEVADGQPWRLVTSLVVQDGGRPGTVFNLAVLAVVGTVAERRWGPCRWLVIALAGGVGAQFWGMVAQPAGAGNSVLVFGLAASLLVLAFRHGPPASRALAVVGLLAGLVLLLGRDVHGGAVVIGLAVAAPLSRARVRTTAS